MKGVDIHYKRALRSIVGILVVMLLIVEGNALLSNVTVRWDATEDKIHSLSSGTRKVLDQLSSPVTIRFFYNKNVTDLPVTLTLFAKRVQEFLIEYENAGPGKVRLEQYEPKQDSQEEKWARRFGLRPMQTPSGTAVFCGLVFLQEDRFETIEWLDPARESSLEYNVTRIIHQLQRPERPVLGIISNLPVFGVQKSREDSLMRTDQSARPPWTFIAELKKSYTVQKVPLSADRIDPSTDLLILYHPKDIHPDLRFAVDQYVLGGGNVMVFADPLCLSDNDESESRQILRPGLATEALFSSWGISINPRKVLADLDQASRGGAHERLVEPSAAYITARPAALNQNHLVTAALESMLFPMAGAIEKTNTSPYQFEPLIQSSRNAMLIDSSLAQSEPAVIRSEFQGTGTRFNIAVQIRGKFKTVFEEGPLKKTGTAVGASKDGSGEMTWLKVGKRSATILVVADADLLADRYYLRTRGVYGYLVPEAMNDNLNFLFNACELLTGGDELIELRSRGKVERPFVRVLELERRAREQWLAKEKELIGQIEETNQKLMELERRKDASQALALSPEQEIEVEKIKASKLRVTTALKEVRRKLWEDVNRLGGITKVINIFLMPFVVAVFGIVFSVYRQRKMRRR